VIHNPEAFLLLQSTGRNYLKESLPGSHNSPVKFFESLAGVTVEKLGNLKIAAFLVAVPVFISITPAKAEPGKQVNNPSGTYYCDGNTLFPTALPSSDRTGQAIILSLTKCAASIALKGGEG
jgi:hypothetical protein